MELRCPRCGDRYGPPARFCIRDGYALVLAAPEEPGQAGDPGWGGHRRIWEPGARFVDPASQLTGRFLDGRYEIGERIGEGGMAYVYRGADRQSDAVVAIKVLSARLVSDPESVARLKREAELAMRLDHPNVCHMLAVGSDRGLHYLVMPLLGGEALSTRLEIDGALDWAEAVAILRDLAAGLQHAHDRGVLHRDLKPENVMLVPHEGGLRAVVMDFGLAKPAGPAPAGPKLTATGVVIGTPEFMSPEQIRGLPIDPRSDQYALAVLAFEMLTGDLPFRGGNPQETMLHRLTDEPTRLRDRRPEAPAWLDRVLARAMSREPAARFADLHAFAAALDHAAD